MTPTPPPAYFLPDGDAFVPTSIAQGPWGASLSGNYVGGLLGHAIERDAGDPELQPARLTVDLLRPAALSPLEVRCSVVRQGRRLKLVHAEMIQSGTVVARASALLLRPGEQPPGQIWSSAVDMPALPAEPEHRPDQPRMLVWTYGKDSSRADSSRGLAEWGYDGPKYVWLLERTPLVDGQPMTPFTRVAMAGDVASSLTNYGTAGLHYINADYTVTLSRLPVGPYVGLAALTHVSHAGVAAGSAAMFDGVGPIGNATATALANPGFQAPRAD